MSRYPPPPNSENLDGLILAELSESLGKSQRIKNGILGLFLCSPLVMAAFLQPDPAGLGTHRQLGLPPCTSIWLFGIRCPACGMTTSWAHTVRGNIPLAIRANTTGTLLAILTLVGSVWLFLSAGQGHWIGFPPKEKFFLMVSFGLVGIALTEWMIRLVWFFS